MGAFKPNVVLGITAVIVVLILFSLAQEMNRRWQVQREISRLEGEVNKMEKRVVELTQLNEYFSTPDYRERLAREQLNYKAPGEKVVLIPEHSSATQQTEEENKTAETKRSIPLTWWYLFFVDTPTT